MSPTSLLVDSLVFEKANIKINTNNQIRVINKTPIQIFCSIINTIDDSNVINRIFL